VDLNLSELLEVGFDAFESGQRFVPGERVAPNGLGVRVLEAAGSRPRPSVHADWVDADGGLTPLDALARTAAELGHLLDTLEPGEWACETQVQGATVHDLVVHLVGVERYLLGQLDRRPPTEAARRDDHYPVTRQLASDLLGADSRRLARAWWLEVMDLIRAMGELGPEHPVSYHHLASGIRGLAVVRTFEVWTHEDDIRRATGRALSSLDEGRLSLMSSGLVRSLALGMALAGTMQQGRTARFILTGAGAATFDVALTHGETASQPDITLTVDTLDLCRLASNRIPIGQLAVDVEGDRSLLEPVLVGATAFALD
jgi:uncharacterized protein (TIGR03083 family)